MSAGFNYIDDNISYHEIVSTVYIKVVDDKTGVSTIFLLRIWLLLFSIFSLQSL